MTTTLSQDAGPTPAQPRKLTTCTTTPPRQVRLMEPSTDRRRLTVHTIRGSTMLTSTWSQHRQLSGLMVTWVAVALLLAGCGGIDGSRSEPAAPTSPAETPSTDRGTPVFDPGDCPIGAMGMHADPGEDFEGYETPEAAAEAWLDEIPHRGELVPSAERAEDVHIVEDEQEREARESTGPPTVYVVVNDSGLVVAELIADRWSNGRWNVWDVQWCE